MVWSNDSRARAGTSKTVIATNSTGGWLAAALLGIALTGSPAAAQQPASLGGSPLCEASAALAIPCPDSGNRTCLLVGDNEVGDTLFLFDVDTGNGGALTMRREIPIRAKDDETLSDIEALVALKSGEILVYGSHSRNKQCELKHKRRRTLRGRLSAADFAAEVETSAKKDETISCKRLFNVKRKNATGNVKLLCDAMHAAEEAADGAAELGKKAAEKACNDIHDFNLEGAVGFDHDGEQHIWVGLRAPTVGEHAVMLRQISKKKFEFDAVVRIDLGGGGIRELAEAKDHVWIISGPANDSSKKHGLWRFPKSQLEADRVNSGDVPIRPEKVRDNLPTSSEGLSIVDGRAYVLIDGDQPKKGSDTCKVDSTYITLSVSEL